MFRERFMRFIYKRFFRTIKLLNPSKERRFRYMISSANKFKRMTSGISGQSVKHDVDGAELYLWVITKGSVSAKDDMQIEAMNQKSGTYNLISPINDKITLSGYKVYISENKLNSAVTLKTSI